MKRHLVITVLCTGIVVATAMAQESAPPDDPLAAPTEAGFSMTPEIARSLGHVYVREMMVNHLKMDKAHQDEAVDKAARRIMELAHKLDGPGQQLVQRYMEEQFNSEGGSFVPKDFAKEFAERLLPMLPDIRTFWTDMNRDMRPYLPFKQQMKMAGEMTAVNAGFDAFEANMKKWAAGEAKNTDNPFDTRSEQDKIDDVKLRDDGISEDLYNARQYAQSSTVDQEKSGWEAYLKQFQAFYQINESQLSSGQALLRENIDRLAERLNDPAWKEAYYRNRLWTMMARHLPDNWSHPLTQLLQDQHEQLSSPIEEQRNIFKKELLAIPTLAQKQAAMQRMDDLLIERGIFRADEEIGYPEPGASEPPQAEQQAVAGG